MSYDSWKTTDDREEYPDDCESVPSPLTVGMARVSPALTLALKQAIVDVTIAECDRCKVAAPLVFGLCVKCDALTGSGEDY